jgi:hypothetical protein
VGSEVCQEVCPRGVLWTDSVLRTARDNPPLGIGNRGVPRVAAPAVDDHPPESRPGTGAGSGRHRARRLAMPRPCHLRLAPSDTHLSAPARGEQVVLDATLICSRVRRFRAMRPSTALLACVHRSAALPKLGYAAAHTLRTPLTHTPPAGDGQTAKPLCSITIVLRTPLCTLCAHPIRALSCSMVGLCSTARGTSDRNGGQRSGLSRRPWCICGRLRKPPRTLCAICAHPGLNIPLVLDRPPHGGDRPGDQTRGDRLDNAGPTLGLGTPADRPWRAIAVASGQIPPTDLSRLVVAANPLPLQAFRAGLAG